MRQYLVDFFKDFAYQDEDASILLSAYDKTVADKEACTLLHDAIAAYEKNVRINYNEEILERATKIAEIIGMHRYTTQLLLFICLSKHLRTLYVERGLDLQIFHDSMLDLKWKLDECLAVKGICGSFVADWFPGFFALARFALGRLQFEITHLEADYEKNGLHLKKGESRAINVHIPRTGTPMDKQSCDAAYAQARAFFASELGENAPFVCHSWLLFPENLNILSPTTNTYRFASEYDIIDWGYNDGGELWRLFDTHELNPARLPTNGSLRRAYVEHLKSGGRVGWGYGIKI